MNRTLKIFKYISNLPQRAFSNFVSIVLASAVITSSLFTGIGLAHRIRRWWSEPAAWLAEHPYMIPSDLEGYRNFYYIVFSLGTLFLLWLVYETELKRRRVEKHIYVEEKISTGDIHNHTLCTLLKQDLPIIEKVLSTKDPKQLEELRKEIEQLVHSESETKLEEVKTLDKRLLVDLLNLPSTISFAHRTTASIIYIGALIGLLTSIVLSRFTDHPLPHILLSAIVSLASGSTLGSKFAFKSENFFPWHKDTEEAISICRKLTQTLEDSGVDVISESILKMAQENEEFKEEISKLKSLLNERINTLKQYHLEKSWDRSASESELLIKTLVCRVNGDEYTVMKASNGITIIHNNEVIFDNTKTPPILKIDPNLLTKIVKTL